jgi:hypothetical protein
MSRAGTAHGMSRFVSRRLVAALAALAFASVAAPGSAGRASAIEVLEGSWGGSEPAEIAKIVGGVVDVFPPPAAGPATIRIRHRFGGPMIRYDLDRDGAVVVYLSARDGRWYQYVYQFAHEYCHLLSSFERKQVGHEIVREHQWFEESLCEAASLYALRRLAARWREAPPDPLLGAAAPLLARYADQLLDEPHRQLGDGAGFAAWYARNEGHLRREPYARETNEAVAMRLLPMFEKEPRRWAALAYLNATPPSPEQSFADFLAAWRAAVPPELRPVVDEIRALFGAQPKRARE